MAGKAEVVEGGAEEFPASLFPALCKGLIKYGWCLEQSRGKWDSTNSTSSPGKPILLRWSLAVFFALSVSPSWLIPLSSPLSLPHSFPFSQPFSLPSSVSVYQLLWWQSASIFTAHPVCSGLFPPLISSLLHLFILLPSSLLISPSSLFFSSLWWLPSCLISAYE